METDCQQAQAAGGSGSPATGASRIPIAAGSSAILCVDDDPNVLDALRRQFRKTFKIETANGPEQGLAAIRSQGPFAVVISDLRMPGMNGIQFLAAARTLSPETVRVMLTGQADLADAISAVNQGSIFRFLLKPSSAVVLTKVIEAALEQHRLIVAERQLTRQTLVGCVEVLADVLSIVEPIAFSRTTRVLRYVRQLTSILKLPDSWQIEAAAMLSQVGQISLPNEITRKVAAAEPLTAEESRRFREHPAAAARLIERIPRLEAVAKIIEAQFTPFDAASGVNLDSPSDSPCFASAVLRAAIELDDGRRRGLAHSDVVAKMRLSASLFPSEIISALAQIEKVELAEESRVLPFSRLEPGMILEQDICGRNGICLFGRGQELTPTLLQRLRGFSEVMDADPMINVRLPSLQPIGEGAS